MVFVVVAVVVVAVVTPGAFEVSWFFDAVCVLLVLLAVLGLVLASVLVILCGGCVGEL